MTLQGATSVEVYGFTGWITTAVAYGMRMESYHKLAQHIARKTQVVRDLQLYTCVGLTPQRQFFTGLVLHIILISVCAASSYDSNALWLWKTYFG